MTTATHYVIARDSNVLRVNFRREPEPPSPPFPGAAGLREFIPLSVNAVASRLLQAEAAERHSARRR